MIFTRLLYVDEYIPALTYRVWRPVFVGENLLSFYRASGGAMLCSAVFAMASSVRLSLCDIEVLWSHRL